MFQDLLKTKVHCQICNKPVDNVTIQEDMILCRTQYFAECHGAVTKLEINMQATLLMPPSQKILAFGIQGELSLN